MLELYQRIREHLAQTVTYRHWHTENHPAPHQVEQWIAAGELYLALAGDEIAGGVVLNNEAPDAYRTADWAIDAPPEHALVVHVLGVAPTFLGRGVARFLMDQSLQVARDGRCVAVRLDVIEDNTPAQQLYTSYGFTDLGLHIIEYEGTDLNRFHLFEHVL